MADRRAGKGIPHVPSPGGAQPRARNNDGRWHKKRSDSIMITTKERWYEVRVSPQTDDLIKELANSIDGDATKVFDCAMRFYYAVKTRQLKENVRVFLENDQGVKTESINV